MSEPLIALSIDALFAGDGGHPDIARFIAEFSETLYPGGREAELLRRLDLTPGFPARLLLGLPESALPLAHRRLAEAFCVDVFAASPQGELWTSRPAWRPHNPQRTPAPLESARLDEAFCLSLGISKNVWRSEILFSTTALQGRPPTSPQAVKRDFLALAAYGFPDPWQFFHPTDRLKSAYLTRG